MSKKENIPAGTIVKILVKNKRYCPNGFAMGDIMFKKDNVMSIHQEIDLESFPSFKDFKGQKSDVNDGTVAIILNKVGRPLKINTDKKWEYYDVYEIMLEGSVKRQIFRNNIELVDISVINHSGG